MSEPTSSKALALDYLKDRIEVLDKERPLTMNGWTALCAAKAELRLAITTLEQEQ